jgi:hypothetical protein
MTDSEGKPYIPGLKRRGFTAKSGKWCKCWDGSARKRLGLRAESGPSLADRGNVLRQKLQRNKSAKTGVLGLRNDSHPAAEFFDQAVIRNGLSNEWRVWHCAGIFFAARRVNAAPNPPTPNWFYGA